MKLELSYTKSALASIYVTSLKGYDNDLFAAKILEIGDQQNRLNNVKADMTEWQSFFPEWKELSMDVVSNHLIELVGNIEATWIVHSLWGVNYRKGDHTIFHDHSPSTFSFCYYVKIDKGSSPLVFSDIDYKHFPEENSLIIFPSHLKHGVPSQISDGRRIVISGNINAISGLTTVDEETFRQGLIEERTVVCRK